MERVYEEYVSKIPRQKRLTKKDLFNMGVLDITLTSEGWRLFRVSKGGGRSKRKKGEVYYLYPYLNTAKHPYGKDTTYMMVGIGGRAYPLHRVLYAWFNGEVKMGYDVDHIDGNSLNNSLDNLRMVKHKENLDTRENKNAWKYRKKVVDKT